jgi:hypothetical protein
MINVADPPYIMTIGKLVAFCKRLRSLLFGILNKMALDTVKILDVVTIAPLRA